jgi:ferric-dicitrate binding protein FerR (iron transport regulator)
MANATRGINRRGMLGGAAALVLASGHARAASDVGVVETAEGETWAETLPPRPLAPAAPIFAGDQVATGPASRIALMLAGTTRVLMGAETRLLIDRYVIEAGGELVLGQGAMLFDRDEGAPKSPVELSTAFGLIAVRGTRFFAGPSNGVFGVFVERGSVSMTGGGSEVTVNAGFGTDIAAPGAAPNEPRAWGKARIDAAYALVGA